MSLYLWCLNDTSSRKKNNILTDFCRRHERQSHDEVHDPEQKIINYFHAYLSGRPWVLTLGRVVGWLGCPPSLASLDTPTAVLRSRSCPWPYFSFCGAEAGSVGEGRLWLWLHPSSYSKRFDILP